LRPWHFKCVFWYLCHSFVFKTICVTAYTIVHMRCTIKCLALIFIRMDFSNWRPWYWGLRVPYLIIWLAIMIQHHYLTCTE
jgi:hypothetical protein